jgi:hypothetical protein
MRALAAALLLGLVPVALASEDTKFDRQLAVDAGRPYVVSYLQRHPVQTGHLNWADPVVEFVPSPAAGPTFGYVAVFFPQVSGKGSGAAIFEVRDDPGHLIVVAWGYMPDLQAMKARFEAQVKAGSIPDGTI